MKGNVFMKKKAQKFIRDQNGSEVLEFLSTFWWLILLAFAMVLFGCFVYNQSKLNDLGKRIVRITEVSGVYSTAEVSTLVKNLYYGDEPVSITSYMTDNNSGASTSILHDGDKIQLRQTFMVKLDSYYRPRILNDAAIKFPMHTIIHGMSEVYNQDVTGDEAAGVSPAPSGPSGDTLVINPSNYDPTVETKENAKASTYVSAHPTAANP